MIGDDKKMAGITLTHLKINWIKIGLILILSLVIFIPRVLPFPPLFLTYDEIEIGEWTSRMTQGLLSGQWQNTVNNAYPAVSLMWLEAIRVKVSQMGPAQTFSQTQLLSDAKEDVFASLPSRRLTLALANSIILGGIGGLLWRLYNGFVAVIAIILIALDPFILTQARVYRTEALSTGLMLLSALAILLYAKEKKGYWLIAGGVLAGWATLTKFTSLYLWPFTGLVLLTWPLLTPTKRQFWPLIWQTTRDLFFWSLCLALTVVVFWPALWVSPGKAFNIVYNYFSSVTGSDLIWGGSVFFLGQVVHGDPGPMFYLLILAYRSTPLIWLGIILLIAGLLLSWLKPARLSVSFQQTWPVTWLILAYITFYFIGMSLGVSKVDRYLQPIFPGLGILAVIGFYLMVEWLAAIIRHKRLIESITCLSLLVSGLWLAWLHQPYYFSYWNPLLGGGQTAVKLLPAGSLEGVDTVIEYLNTQPNVRQLNLAGAGEFFYFCEVTFKGHCVDDINLLASDFFLTHLGIQQRQLRFADIQTLIPDATLAAEYTHDDIKYVQLYKMPAGLHQADEWIGPNGKLVGYQLPVDPLKAGDTFKISLFWLNGEQGWRLTDSEFWVKLLDNSGKVWQIAPAQFSTPFKTQPWEILGFTAAIDLPPDIPPGLYHLEMGLKLKASGQETWRFALTDTANTITVNQGLLNGSADRLSIQHRFNQSLADTGLTLLGYNDLTTGQPPAFEFYWRAEKPLSQNYRLKLTLLDDHEQPEAAWNQALVPDIHPLTAWQPGEIVKTPLNLEVGYLLPAASYQPVLSILAAGAPSNQLPPAEINLLPTKITFTSPKPAIHHFLNARFDPQLDLLGYDLWGKQNSTGNGSLLLSLYWLNRYALPQVEAEVNLLKTGQVIAQQTLPVPSPANFGEWQSVSHYEFSLSTVPDSMTIKVKPVGSAIWLKAQLPNQPAAEQLVIENVPAQVVPVSE